MIGTTDIEFANIVDQRRDQLCFVQGAQAMASFMSMMQRAFAQAQQAAQPTPESIHATRRAMGEQGLASLLTSRPKLTAAQRREAEMLEQSRRLGFVNGRFVG